MTTENSKSANKKTVIITGASGNLGSAVTKKFLDTGYNVIATVTSPEIKESIPGHENLNVEIVNLADEDETTSFVKASIEKYKNIDAALMLVGGFTMGNIAATTGADLKKQFSLNFETAYYVARPLFQHMMTRGEGRLVFIGSRPALNAVGGKSVIAYGLSKSLLFKLAEYLNAEAKGKNVTATVIAPSTLDTEPNRKSMPDANPGNWVKPEQLADILEFVTSEKGSTLRETVLKVYNNS
jgi:NAD(P)-dependent dehydrogenase (short-subunit alcohol dehydrogenase family)